MKLSSSDIRIIAGVTIVVGANIYGSYQLRKINRTFRKNIADMTAADEKLYSSVKIVN